MNLIPLLGFSRDKSFKIICHGSRRHKISLKWFMCLPLEASRRNNARMITNTIERQRLYSVHTNRVPPSTVLVVIEPGAFEREMFRTFVTGRVCTWELCELFSCSTQKFYL